MSLGEIIAREQMAAEICRKRAEAAKTEELKHDLAWSAAEHSEIVRCMQELQRYRRTGLTPEKLTMNEEKMCDFCKEYGDNRIFGADKNFAKGIANFTEKHLRQDMIRIAEENWTDSQVKMLKGLICAAANGIEYADAYEAVNGD